MRLSRICPSTNFSSRSNSLKMLFLFLLSLSLVSSSLGARILIIHPIYSGSHVLTLRSVAESMTQRGHHVHILRWKDMHSFPAVNNANITETLLSMDNSQGDWTFLTKEKNAAFKVLR